MSISFDGATASNATERGFYADTPAEHAGIRIGVVGCGYWGSKHVRVLSSAADAAEVAIIEPNKRLRDSLQTTFPALRTFSNLESSLPHLDAVVIATPPSTHAELALAAIREGKHVLVEKPLATSVWAAREMVEQSVKNGVVLMVGHTFQFNPAVRELRRRLVAGELGDVYYIHSARLNLGLYQPDVNVVWDLAPHDISILNYLLGSRPRAVTAWADSLAFGRVEDLAYVRLQYEYPRVAGYVHLSWLDPRKTRTVTVVGSDRMAVYDDLAEERLRIYDRGVERSDCSAPLHERPPAYRYGDIIAPHIRADEPLALQDKHFIGSILTGTSPETNGSRGMEVVAVLAAIETSLRERIRVVVEEP